MSKRKAAPGKGGKQAGEDPGASNPSGLSSPVDDAPSPPPTGAASAYYIADPDACGACESKDERIGELEKKLAELSDLLMKGETIRQDYVLKFALHTAEVARLLHLIGSAYAIISGAPPVPSPDPLKGRWRDDARKWKREASLVLEAAQSGGTGGGVSERGSGRDASTSSEVSSAGAANPPPCPCDPDSVSHAEGCALIVPGSCEVCEGRCRVCSAGDGKDDSCLHCIGGMTEILRGRVRELEAALAKERDHSEEWAQEYAKATARAEKAEAALDSLVTASRRYLHGGRPKPGVKAVLEQAVESAALVGVKK